MIILFRLFLVIDRSSFGLFQDIGCFFVKGFVLVLHEQEVHYSNF
jgi:hypothetical protein